MPFPWAAVIGAGATLGSAYLSSRASSRGAEAANDLQAQLFRENLAWQREHAQNRVQWMADDYEKAGFNRLLATGVQPGGTGVSGIPNMRNTKEHATQMALTTARLGGEIAQMYADKKKKDTESDLNSALLNKVAYDTMVSASNARAAHANADIAERDRDFGTSRYGKILYGTKKTADAILGPIATAAGMSSARHISRALKSGKNRVMYRPYIKEYKG